MRNLTLVDLGLSVLAAANQSVLLSLYYNIVGNTCIDLE